MITKGNYKKLLSSIIALALTLAMIFPLSLSLSSCSQLSALKSITDAAGDLEKYQEAISKLTDYKITIESEDESGNKSTMTEMRCDKGYALISGDNITYVEYGTGKMYILSPTDKTGWEYKLDNDDSYKNFGITISVYLYSFEAYKFLGAKKSGSEKIAGRKTTTYTYSADGTDYKFWIDDEYGLTMKTSAKSADGTSTMEIKEFKTKGVTLTDMVNLSEYKIEDLSAIGS